jgi:hypothetical protein
MPPNAACLKPGAMLLEPIIWALFVVWLAQAVYVIMTDEARAASSYASSETVDRKGLKRD